MNQKQDRRIVRTKLEIKEAFTSLLEEKGFHAITVRDLTQRANINRGTFYLHYMDKYDLLEKCEEEVFQRLEEVVQNVRSMDMTILLTEQPPSFVVNLLEYVQENASFMKAILGPNGESSFQERLRNFLVENLFNNISSFVGESSLAIPIDLLAQVVSSAYVGAIRHWLDTDMQQSPAELAAMLFQIVKKGPLEASGLMKCLIGQERKGL